MLGYTEEKGEASQSQNFGVHSLMSTQAYLGVELGRDQLMQRSVIRSRCSKEPRHELNGSQKFCPECGNQVISDHSEEPTQMFRLLSEAASIPAEDLFYDLTTSGWEWVPTRTTADIVVYIFWIPTSDTTGVLAAMIPLEDGGCFAPALLPTIEEALREAANMLGVQVFQPKVYLDLN